MFELEKTQNELNLEDSKAKTNFNFESNSQMATLDPAK